MDNESGTDDKWETDGELGMDDKWAMDDKWGMDDDMTTMNLLMNDEQGDDNQQTQCTTTMEGAV